MVEPVDWRADGIPRSARFDDIYHSESGAPAQARHVFLGGCGLPAAWAEAPATSRERVVAPNAQTGQRRAARLRFLSMVVLDMAP